MRNFLIIFYNQWFILFQLLLYLFTEFSFERIISSSIKDRVQWPYECYIFNAMFVVSLLILMSVLVLGCYKHRYRLESITLKQLINNALGYKWTTLSILFFFMMHFSWTIDAGYNIFVNAELYRSTWEKVFQVILPLGGMFFSALLIPEKQERKISLSEADIFLSCISVTYVREEMKYYLRPHNLDLLFKPFFHNGIDATLTNVKEELKKIRKFLIIPSDALLGCIVDTSKNWDDLLEKLKNSKMCNNIDDTTFLEAAEKYNQAIKNNLVNDFDAIKQFLSLLLPVDFVFPTLPVNYDEFGQVFKVASQLLNENESSDSYSLIHISPGTSIPAGALTALGIKKNRVIVYTWQNVDDKVSSIDIDVSNMNEWLEDLLDDKEVKV